MVSELHDIFEQDSLWERDGRSSFTTDDRSVIATTLTQLSKTDLISGSDFDSLVASLRNELGASQVAAEKTEKKFERQEGVVSVAKKSKNNVLNDVASLRGRVMVTSTSKTELPSNESAVSSQIARDTAEPGQTHDTIST